jgi:hypothetical protein
VRRLLLIAIVGAATVSLPLAADEMSVQMDPKADFSKFNTFAMRNARIETPRPELANTLFEKKLRNTIRDGLVARGLKEAASRPDLNVDFAISGQETSTTARSGLRGMGPVPVRFTTGALVIDMTRFGESDPVWRGLYRDDETTGSKLVQRLPEDARKLIDRYPRRAK